MENKINVREGMTKNLREVLKGMRECKQGN